MSEPMTPEFYAKVRRHYRVDDLPEWREHPVSDLCDEIDRLRTRVAELEEEIARVAPFLANHRVAGYSFGPVQPTPEAHRES